MGRGENMRGVHALELLAAKHDFTLEGLRAAAFDSHLPGFERALPGLFAAYDALAADDPQRTQLADQVALLRGWDRRWAADSAATSLAVFWGEALWQSLGKKPVGGELADYDYVLDRATPAKELAALKAASDRLTADFGSWKIAWGKINRVQRLRDDIELVPSDDQRSTPVGFTTAQWGSLAAVDGVRYPGVKKRYGDRGNSFVAAVEFGPKVRALAVTAGGESGDPASRHFNDQAERYATGALREVYFYPEQLKGHTERTYHPGE
jgi:acyl-homoserine-lactone acylase